RFTHANAEEPRSPMPYGDGSEVTCNNTPEARYSGGNGGRPTGSPSFIGWLRIGVRCSRSPVLRSRLHVDVTRSWKFPRRFCRCSRFLRVGRQTIHSLRQPSGRLLELDCRELSSASP